MSKKSQILLDKFQADIQRAKNTIAQKQQEIIMAQGILSYLQIEIEKITKENKE